MEYYNNILCVTCEELTSGDNPVMKYITLYQNVRRGNIEKYQPMAVARAM